MTKSANDADAKPDELFCRWIAFQSRQRTSIARCK